VSDVELDDERSFLLDSLEDLERERAAGDIGDADYVRLRDRYTRRAAAALRRAGPEGVRPSAIHVERTCRAATSPPASPSTTRGSQPRRRRRAYLVGGMCALVAALVLWVVLATTSARLPGQTATGTVRLSAGQQLRATLAEAHALEGSGDDAGALALYQQVLSSDPTQVDALSASGWLEFQAGVQARNSAVLARAQDQEEQAVRLDPGAYAPRAYLGSMLLAENDAAGAVTQFRAFLSDHPPADQVAAARSYITRAFEAEHLPVPALAP